MAVVAQMLFLRHFGALPSITIALLAALQDDNTTPAYRRCS
jgi:hypothetical protein